jgi:hypothetical protein
MTRTIMVRSANLAAMLFSAASASLTTAVVASAVLSAPAGTAV